MQQQSRSHFPILLPSSYKTRSFLHKLDLTLTLDFKQHAVHFLHEDHGLQYLGQLLSIVLHLLINEPPLEIDRAVGWNLGSLHLRGELMRIDEFAISLRGTHDEGTANESFEGVVDHVVI